MKCCVHLATVVCLICALLSAQSRQSSTEQKHEPPKLDSDTQELKQPYTAKIGSDYGLGLDTKATGGVGPFEILSDTMGVDFAPYLAGVVRNVKQNWHGLIPESAKTPTMKRGKVTIEFALLKDGSIAGMKLVSTSGAIELDRAAWDSITASNPFLPLPTEFSGLYLALRFAFYYNPDKAAFAGISASPMITPTKSRVAVSISPPHSVKVPIGGSVATLTGTTNTAVKWSVTGTGCSDSACGTMQGDLYLAPSSLPSPPSLTLTATSEADPTATASITVNLITDDEDRK